MPGFLILFDLLILGAITVFNLTNMFWISFGVLIGIIFGAIPGLTATMGIVLFMPFTFKMSAIPAIGALLGIYCGGIYGGSVTAILINTPGIPASAATSLDGFELTKQGKSGIALRMALFASVIGGLISTMMLIFIAPILARFALRFGPLEYSTLILLGLTVIAGVGGDSLIKGLIAGAIGLFLSCIGQDPMLGIPRLIFGNINLAGGVGIIPALVGLFAISEILIQAESIGKQDLKINRYKNIGNQSIKWREFKKYLLLILKSSLIGTYIGAIPGIGAAPAAFMSYNEAKRSSSTPEKFGKGYLGGVAASEAANNGVTGATFIPLLTLGIPGDTVTAVLLGAFMIQGLIPGPLLFQKHGETVFALFVALIFANVIMLIIAYLGIKYCFSYVGNISGKNLYPIIFIMCAVGSFAVELNTFQIAVVLVFGIIGYALRKFGMSCAPVLIAILLGPIFEANIRRSILMFHGKYFIIFTKPIAMLFLILTIISIYWIMKNQKRITQFRKIPDG